MSVVLGCRPLVWISSRCTYMTPVNASILLIHPAAPQLFWQDYQDRSYFTALRHLLQLRSMGKIRSIGLCNFDTRRTDEICTVLGPGAIVSNQVQVSRRDTGLCHADQT